MNWQDDEFERYLRQFQLRKPRPLPRRPGMPVLLAAAALIALAIVVPMRTWSSGGAASNSGPSSAPEKPASASAPNEAPALTNVPARAGAAGAKQPDGFVASSGSASAAAGAARRVRVGGAVKPPRRVHNVDPDYPQEAQAAGIEGMVVLDIVVGVDGSVIQIDVVTSIPELDQAAIDAARQWRFETTLLNGEPIEVAMNVTINFTLR
jgi:TonB family protein